MQQLAGELQGVVVIPVADKHPVCHHAHPLVPQASLHVGQVIEYFPFVRMVGKPHAEKLGGNHVHKVPVVAAMDQGKVQADYLPLACLVILFAGTVEHLDQQKKTGETHLMEFRSDEQFAIVFGDGFPVLLDHSPCGGYADTEETVSLAILPWTGLEKPHQMPPFLLVGHSRQSCLNGCGNVSFLCTHVAKLQNNPQKRCIFADVMANIIEITGLELPELAVYTSLTEAQLRNRLRPGEGLFIAESPKVIEVALRAGYEPVSLLCEKRHITGDAAGVVALCGDIPVYTGTRELLASLTGYTLTRGVLCAMRRKPMPSVEEVCRNARRVVVLDAVTDTTNIGAIFRSAAALGVDAALLTPSTCDPLNRRAVRVSMGSVFLLPWTWLPDDSLRVVKELGFTTLAMALCDDSVSIDSPELKEIERIAFVMGTEGDGLSRERIAETDITVRIPMSHGVDSLNVAAASAVAFYALRYDNGK